MFLCVSRTLTCIRFKGVDNQDQKLNNQINQYPKKILVGILGLISSVYSPTRPSRQLVLSCLHFRPDYRLYWFRSPHYTLGRLLKNTPSVSSHDRVQSLLPHFTVGWSLLRHVIIRPQHPVTKTQMSSLSPSCNQSHLPSFKKRGRDSQSQKVVQVIRH